MTRRQDGDPGSGAIDHAGVPIDDQLSQAIIRNAADNLDIQSDVDEVI